MVMMKGVARPLGSACKFFPAYFMPLRALSDEVPTRVRRRITSSLTRRREKQRRKPEGAGADTSSEKTFKFHDAVERGDADFVRSCINRGMDVNFRDPGRANVSPLHLASRRGFVDIVSLLLEHGACPNIKGPWKYTPLHYAAIFHEAKVAKILLDSGANANAIDDKGFSVMDHARRERQDDIIELLEREL